MDSPIRRWMTQIRITCISRKKTARCGFLANTLDSIPFVHTSYVSFLALISFHFLSPQKNIKSSTKNIYCVGTFDINISPSLSLGLLPSTMGSALRYAYRPWRLRSDSVGVECHRNPGSCRAEKVGSEGRGIICVFSLSLCIVFCSASVVISNCVSDNLESSSLSILSLPLSLSG